MARSALRPSVQAVPPSSVLVPVVKGDRCELGLEALRGAELDLRGEESPLALRAREGRMRTRRREVGRLTFLTIVQTAAIRATEEATAMMAMRVARLMPEEEEDDSSLSEVTDDEAAEDVAEDVREDEGSVTVRGTTVVLPLDALPEVVAGAGAEVVGATGAEVAIDVSSTSEDEAADVPAIPRPVVSATGAVVAAAAVVPAAAAVVCAALTVPFVAWRFMRSSIRRSMSWMCRGRTPASCARARGERATEERARRGRRATMAS